jgi:hypothetical protein
MKKTLCIALTLAGVVVAPHAASAEPALADESPALSFGIGGGVTAFYDTDMTQYIDSGATWDMRVVVGTRSPIAVEVAYVGSLQDIDVYDMGDASLLGTGLEADLRLNIVPGVATPFLVAGAGWTHYDVLDAQDNGTMAADGDDVITLPVGLGLDYRVGSYVIDGRGLLRPTFDNDLVPSSGGTARLDSWTLLLRGATEF